MQMNSIQKRNLNIGYCCLNMNLRSLGIFTSRTCRLETIRKLGIEYAYKLARQNLEDLASILKWNYKNGIYLYRMSSEIFPFATHPEYYHVFDLDQFQPTLVKLGDMAKSYGQRLTFHPGQHCVLSSDNPIVVKNAIADIDFHAKVMDYMGLSSDGVIVIHGGSKKDGKDVALDRLDKNYRMMSLSAQKRLVLENCETMYAIEDLLPLSNKLQIPIVIDYHHHNINKGSKTKSLQELTSDVLQVWSAKGITPLFHMSESKPGVTKSDSMLERRAHSEYVTAFPDDLLHVLMTNRIDLDIEAKHKERAVKFLQKKYKFFDNINNINSS
jgi:UV DNA damage endonuclease